jgi:hypothetical protein
VNYTRATKTYRSERYLAWVRSLPSVVDGAIGCVAHHITGHGQGGMAIKPSDLLTFPLTPEQHGELHHDFKAWEYLYGSQWKWVALTLAGAQPHWSKGSWGWAEVYVGDEGEDPDVNPNVACFSRVWIPNE